MKKAFWFSRHTPTTEQLAEVKAMGFDLQVTRALTQLAEKQLETEEQVQAVISVLTGLGTPVFGVFSVPMQAVLTERAVVGVLETVNALPCYSAWNIMRTVEGGKPTFQHKKFVQVGVL